MSYDARESSTYGGAPVELFRFACGVQSWGLTSGDTLQTLSGLDYTPTAMTRGEIDTNDEDAQDALELTLPRDHEIPQLFIPDLPVRPVTLEVLRFHRGDAEVIRMWSGEIASVRFEGSLARLTGLPITRVLRRRIPPNSFQSQCNWALYSPECGLDRTSRAQPATLSAVSGLTITSPAFGTHPDGYFQAGYVENAAGETHWITQHAGNVLTLLTPFRAIAAGAAVTAYPGCDHTIAACKAFGNLVHFCGFPFIPTKNPFVSGAA